MVVLKHVLLVCVLKHVLKHDNLGQYTISIRYQQKLQELKTNKFHCIAKKFF